MEMGSSSREDRCHVIPMEGSGSSLPMPTMELDIANFEEVTARSSSSNIDHPLVAISHMVSNSSSNVQQQTHHDSSTQRSPTTRSQSKRSREESPLVSFGMEHKLRRLTVAGASQSVLEMVNHSANRRTQRNYSYHQRLFHKWCRDNDMDPLSPSASMVVNFLAWGSRERNWQPATVYTYKSAILDRCENRQQILDSWLYQQFMSSLGSSSIRPQPETDLDISPVLAHLRTLGDNRHMDQDQLTAKLCWLLSICGFLRASDIERIDLNQSIYQDNATPIKLVIVCPKEKRQGQRIIRTVTIQPHTNTTYCPVVAFNTYIHRFASQPCMIAHPVLDNVQINCLIRSLHSHTRSIGAQRIGQHINSFMRLIPGVTSTKKRNKGRAIGSSLAVAAGVPVDDIMAHGNWSSRAMFDTFYRLSRNTHSNMSNLVLDSIRRDG